VSRRGTAIDGGRDTGLARKDNGQAAGEGDGRAIGERPARRAGSIAVDLLIMLASFVLASALAGALGATNLGTALAFGQIGFAISLVYVLLKR
jgi:hypothetical protein